MRKLTMNRGRLLVPIATAITLLAAACSGADERPTQEPAQPSDEAATQQSANTPSGPSSPRAASTEPGTSGALTAQEIYLSVSPSIVFIETPTGTGSGILVGEGLIITNAHVVWPFDEVRVVFPSGEEISAAPVTAIDLMADIALLQIEPTNIVEPVLIGSPEELEPGAPLYLIGYPGEGETFPQPALATGVLSRFRTWDAIGLRYVQTDASIAGGQSGGALVSPTGEVIGLSTFSFAEGNFALAASMPDLMERVAALQRGEDVDGLGERGYALSRTPVLARFVFDLENFFHQRTFILQADLRSPLSVSVTSDSDAWISIDLAGAFNVAFIDELIAGTETTDFTIEFDEPYLITVGQSNVDPGRFSLTVSMPLIELIDPDDGRNLRAGQVMSGYLEHENDVDYFEIDLAAGDELTVIADSTAIDPFLVIDQATNVADALATDDDSGGGFFGVSARATYIAEAAGTYIVTVEDSQRLNGGAYILTVEVAPN